MPPRRARARVGEASSSRRRRRSPTPPPSPPPSPLLWELPTPQQNTRYRMLKKREVTPSKFFDPFTIESLGLQGDVNTFVNTMGWTQFANIRLPTYQTVTYEILSTLRSTFHPHVEGDPVCIFFRCMGEDRQLTMAQFNGIFGFPNAGINWNTPDFHPEVAWTQLTGQGAYNPSISKSRHIRNHALRYIHRVMSMSIFGRGHSVGVVNRVELLFLWAMTNGIQVNTGAWFLKHLLHVAKSPTGNICVGGLLSIIATSFGFMPEEGVHRMVPGINVVDIETLLNMKLCRHMGGGQFRLLDDEGQVVEPPQHEPQEEEEMEEMQQMDEPDQEHEEDLEDSNLPMPDPSQPAYMTHLLERFDRLEARQSRMDDVQMQMMTLLQQNMAQLQQNSEAIARIEDKISHPK